MRTIFTLAAVIVLFVTSIQNAAVASESGNDLLSACAKDDAMLNGYCLGIVAGFRRGSTLGYISGVVAGVKGAITVANPKSKDDNDLMDAYVNGTYKQLRNVGSGDVTCIPDKATNEQLKDVLVKWLKNNPEQRDKDSGYIMYTAFRDSFGYPCNVGEDR